MQAIHVNCTKPFFFDPHFNGQTYEIEDFELLTTIMSALKWREKNGRIKLYCDRLAYEYYKSLGILGIWNEIDNTILENISANMNHHVFWAGSKIFAMQNEKVPFVMLDTDFIVWDRLSILDVDATYCIHKEDLELFFYPIQSNLRIAPDYQWLDLDWTVRPANGALVYHGDPKLLSEYCTESIRFMTDNLSYGYENVSQMVYAEQRLLSQIAAKQGKEIFALLNIDIPFEHQYSFTHVWGLKNEYRQKPLERLKFCVDMAKRIESDFPQVVETLMKIETIKKYFTHG